MTSRHDYDDPHAFYRRWERLDDAALRHAIDRQPLLFVADHVSIMDRRAGSLAFHVAKRDGSSMLILVADGPIEPTADQCVGCLATVVERMGSDAVAGLGVVHHRRGRAHIGDLDRRWHQALLDVCRYYDIDAVGVLARTEAGAIVEVGQRLAS